MYVCINISDIIVDLIKIPGIVCGLGILKMFLR